MTPILQSHLPFAPWMDARTWRLPGILPVEGDDWLRVDDAFATQMAERDRLCAEAGAAVIAMLGPARPAAEELFDTVLGWLEGQPGYVFHPDAVVRPDGATVTLDRDNPMTTLCRLVQEDLCLMERIGDEQVLTAAALCFPASWTLAQKIGQPMIRIHVPVESYTPDVARRVQRLFDAIRPGQMLWRANALVYDDPTLHQPRPEGVHRPRPKQAGYLRSERQTLRRLPRTGAVVFAIHTYVVRVADLDPAERAGLEPSGLWP